MRYCRIKPMKDILLPILVFTFIVGAITDAKSQNWAIYKGAERLNVVDIIEGVDITVRTDIRITRFYVVDTTLIIVGYKGARRDRGIHGYYNNKMDTWTTSLCQVLKNKRIDSTKEEDFIKLQDLYNLQSPNPPDVWVDWKTSHLLKFKINNKIDSVDYEKDPLYIRNKYKYLHPEIVQLRERSNNFQNKCLFNVWMFIKEKKDPRYTHSSQAFLCLFDIEKKKIVKSFPVEFGTMENLIIVE